MANGVATGTQTTKALFRDKYFLTGYRDVAKNRGWNAEYDGWYTGAQWNYERGRQYAAMTGTKYPPQITDRRGKRVLNTDGRYEFIAAYNRKHIL